MINFNLKRKNFNDVEFFLNRKKDLAKKIREKLKGTKTF
jgi:hypothetical protein